MLSLSLALFLIVFILLWNDFILDRYALVRDIFVEIESVHVVRGSCFSRHLLVQRIGFYIVRLAGLLQILPESNLLSSVLMKLSLRVIQGLELLRLGSWLDMLEHLLAISCLTVHRLVHAFFLFGQSAWARLSSVWQVTRSCHTFVVHLTDILRFVWALLGWHVALVSGARTGNFLLTVLHWLLLLRMWAGCIDGETLLRCLANVVSVTTVFSHTTWGRPICDTATSSNLLASTSFSPLRGWLQGSGASATSHITTYIRLVFEVILTDRRLGSRVSLAFKTVFFFLVVLIDDFFNFLGALLI